MDYGDERWVRLFTRDTGTWVAFKPESRAVLPSILRKLDRKGRLEWPPKLGVRGLAALLMLRDKWVEVALVDLSEHGTIVYGPGWLEMVNFVPAQNARSRAMTGAERTAAWKDRSGYPTTRAERALVTRGDTADEQVTVETPSPAQPSSAQYSPAQHESPSRRSGDARASDGSKSTRATRSRARRSARAPDIRAVPVMQRIDEHRERLGLGRMRQAQRDDRLIVQRLDEDTPLEDLLLVIDLRAAELEAKLARDPKTPDAKYFNATSPFTGPGPHGPGGWSVSMGMLDAHRARSSWSSRRPAVIDDHDLPEWARAPEEP